MEICSKAAFAFVRGGIIIADAGGRTETAMPEAESHKVDYMVLIINEYAKENRLSTKEAFFQLLDCGGIDALDEFYDIEHTLPVSTTIQDLRALYLRSVA